MIVNYDTMFGRSIVRIESESIEEVQEAINNHRARFLMRGPEKSGDKYIALGVEETNVRRR